MHVTKLNLALQTGVPLERWGNGLMVLLEKEFVSIYMEKLRAICLFEANLNWLEKLIFAKCVMFQAMEEGIVPPEYIAKAGTDANEGSMLKIQHNDIHCRIGINSAAVNVDLKNCYNAIHHSIAKYRGSSDGSASTCSEAGSFMPTDYVLLATKCTWKIRRSVSWNGNETLYDTRTRWWTFAYSLYRGIHIDDRSM